MSVDQMRTWLMQARPWWNPKTVMGWSDKQVIRIYYKELNKGTVLQPPQKKAEAAEQLRLPFEYD